MQYLPEKLVLIPVASIPLYAAQKKVGQSGQVNIEISNKEKKEKKAFFLEKVMTKKLNLKMVGKVTPHFPEVKCTFQIVGNFPSSTHAFPNHTRHKPQKPALFPAARKITD